MHTPVTVIIINGKTYPSQELSLPVRLLGLRIAHQIRDLELQVVVTARHVFVLGVPYLCRYITTICAKLLNRDN